MLNHFRTYRLAVQFHHAVREPELPLYLRDQLLRASSSIALNLSEGSGRETPRDQLRFFVMAMGSLRECQAALDLAPRTLTPLIQQTDLIGAHLFRLCQSKRAEIRG